jgi:hypothetical protein
MEGGKLPLNAVVRVPTIKGVRPRPFIFLLDNEWKLSKIKSDVDFINTGID